MRYISLKRFGLLVMLVIALGLLIFYHHTCPGKYSSNNDDKSNANDHAQLGFG